MIGLEMGRSTDARRAPHLAAVLLGTTILAGAPGIALAQDAATAPAPVAAPPVAAPAVEAGETIQTIQVTGAERLEPQTVLSYIQLRVGQPYTKASGDAALKDLYATELFSDVQVSNDKGVVTIQVKENPVVNRIILEGNKRIKDDKILPEIKVSPRQIFTRSKIRADVARIIELYKRQGRYAATVEPKMVMLDQNRVDIVFEITEGDKSKVRQINIIGNEHFSDGDLRSQMVTKQARFTRLFSSGTSYDPDRMAFDQQKLRQFYLTQGYADFRVVSAVAELTPDKKDFIITYVVEEGKRYKFGEVKVESQLRDFDGEKLAKNLTIHQGDWYDAKKVEDTIEGLNDTAGAFGYAFADVRPQYDRDKENLTMGLTFVIQEAPRVYVEKIDINGNTLTQDKVVRREFRLAEGDAFNSLQVKRSTNRIKSLGYFQEKFEVEQKPGTAEDRIALEANVEEKPTGELQLSAGFSSLERFIFQASIRQRNFRGRGQTVGLSGSYSSYSKSIEASFVEPYLFDKNVSLGVDIYRRDYNSFQYLNSNDRNTTYEQSTTGFQVRAGVPLTEYLTAIARYTLNYDDVTLDKNTYYSIDANGDYTCDPLRGSRYLCDAIGKRLSSILGGSLIYDNLDNRMRPTRGETISLNADLAGLGGDVNYYRLRANAAKYWPLGKGFIFSLQGEGGLIKGWAGDDIRLTDRFYLGEPQMRGFGIRGVGPRVVRQYYTADSDGNYTVEAQDYDDAVGGRYYYMSRAELEIPLGSGAREMGLRPSIFVDAGAVWSVKAPALNDCKAGCFIGSRDSNGNQLYTETAADGTQSTTTSPTNSATGAANVAIGSTNYFTETFLGNTWKPRVAIGFGVNWNSPFGPFRIDISKALLKYDGDNTKTFTFNVGTQF
ncbi:MAG: outer membrane protein assembly factor BamA [Novosphingobium pentaromativorans]|uniref:Outer membrane protein assembly factor BamA n=1 Tax=Novosphingobium pentaromativorans TaxID=205844 RepID=A0A2W5QRN9_9SPHN|nr:outer membrane protein assembly factor BamA [Novosphingobium panipatense]PZQ54130.1 MAG: outer membrane protein assembly factor BamA [Novosphingobium pentaromativorans]